MDFRPQHDMTTGHPIRAASRRFDAATAKT
jgi:hypothetical protein